MSSEIKRFYEFDNFRFDAEKRVLWRNGEIVPLTPKAGEVLSLLVENHGNLLERDEILEKVWEGTFVEEGNLNHAISALRKVLGSNEIIQTIPRRGYRFTAEVRQAFEENPTTLIIEKRTLSQTLIEEQEIIEDEKALLPQKSLPAPSKIKRLYLNLAIVLLLVLSVVGSIWYFSRDSNKDSSVDKAPTKTIAILPLQSLNQQNDDSALSLGITENLASRLGSLDQLVVRPTTSVKKLAETENDPLAVGRKLKAEIVITGSFQRVNERIRMSVRLVNVSDGAQIWAGNFDEIEQDIFKLQDSLSAQAAKYLIDRLTPQEQQQLVAQPTGDLEAYKLYLRGRHAWNKRTAEGFTESIRAYQAAIDRDPAFALSYAGLANSYVLLNDYDVAPPNEAYPKAKAAANKALEIDPNLVEPRTTLAYVLATYEWNWPEAERQYRQVIQINPNFATAHQWYGEMLYATRRFAEAEIELNRAVELDPLVPIIQSELAALHYYSGKYEECLAAYAKVKQEFPNFPTSYLFSAWSYEHLQKFDESFAEEIKFWQLQGVPEPVLEKMTAAYRDGGRIEYLRRLAAMLEEQSRINYVHEYRPAHAYARLRDREKALEWIEKGVEKHSSNIVKIYLDPNFDFLRGESRFQEALRKMNLL